MEPPPPDAPRYRFSEVTDAQWAALRARRMYFGHQSVGKNIMDGVTAVLAAHPAIGLNVVEARTLEADAPPGLYHARIGANGDPSGKLAEVTRIADQGSPSVAMVKYCYVDVTAGTNPDSLFADYQRQIASLRAGHPGIVIVHMTMPLTSIGGRREIVQEWFGRRTSRGLNAIRNRYNDLMRHAYAGREPMFDLATLESTRADGSRVFFTQGGRPVYYLANEYTDDGGHLSDLGRRTAAEEFLALLANL